MSRRLIMLPWVFWAVLIVGTIALVSHCSSAKGQEADTFTMQGPDGSYVRLHATPCPGAPDWLDLRVAEMRYQGKDYKACWFRLQGFVIILDEAKDKTPLPVGAFKKDMRT